MAVEKTRLVIEAQIAGSGGRQWFTDLQHRIVDMVSEWGMTEEIMLTVEYGTPAEQPDLFASESLRVYSPLSERQQQVAELLCRNYSVKRIAAALFVSENTIKKHIQNMKKALKIEASGADFIYQLQQLMQGGGKRGVEDYLIRVK